MAAQEVLAEIALRLGAAEERHGDAAGAGVSLVPASVAKPRGEGVAYRPPEGGAPPARIAVAWKPGNPSHTAEAFLRAVEEVRERAADRRAGRRTRRREEADPARGLPCPR